MPRPETASTLAAAARGRADAASPGAGSVVVQSGVSFGLVSALAYSIWAFRLVPGEPALLYVAIAAVYLGLGGLALSRFVPGPGAWKRFPLIFAAGFLVYAVGWCAFWFGLRGKYLADLWGAAVGLAGMTAVLQRALGHQGGFWPAFAVLFVLHSAGYYAGEQLYAAARGPAGRLLWGAAHGLGFGAGLGYLLFRGARLLKA